MSLLILKISILLSTIMLGVATICVFIRIIRNNTTAKRALALDSLTSIAVTITALFSVWHGNPIYIDIILAFVLVIFLGTVAYSQYIGSKDKEDHDHAA